MRFFPAPRAGKPTLIGCCRRSVRRGPPDGGRAEIKNAYTLWGPCAGTVPWPPFRKGILDPNYRKAAYDARRPGRLECVILDVITVGRRSSHQASGWQEPFQHPSPHTGFRRFISSPPSCCPPPHRTATAADSRPLPPADERQSSSLAKSGAEIAGRSSCKSTNVGACVTLRPNPRGPANQAVLARQVCCRADRTTARPGPACEIARLPLRAGRCAWPLANAQPAGPQPPPYCPPRCSLLRALKGVRPRI